MANKIKLGRGTKERIETVKGTLEDFEIVYSSNDNEIGVKNPDGSISYFKTQSGIVKGTVATPASTVSKTVIIPNFVLTEGDLLAIKFTLGNTASSPTLNINGSGAIPIKLGGQNPTGTANTGSGYLIANGVMLLYYDGTNLNMSGSNDAADTVYSVMSQAELDTGTATTGRLVSSKLLKDNLQSKLTAGTNITIVDNVISATGVNLDAYYTKSEIDSMIGDIETALDSILGV